MIRIFPLTIVLLACCFGTGEARTFTDSAGRKVEVPDQVNRVFVTGPPAAITVYTLTPEKLLGWPSVDSTPKGAFVTKPYADLPVTGRLTGRGNTASMESVIALRPDVIVDIGVVDPTYASLADRVQEQTRIPYVVIDGAFARTADMYRMLGAVLGTEARAAELAAYAEKTLVAIKPGAARTRVYYGRGPSGLETGLAGSINMEVLAAAGAENVAAAAGKGGLTKVSLEQVLAWNPDVILAHDVPFLQSVVKDPLWQGVKAARDRRVYHAPDMPWGWFDSPPGPNRLIGVRWIQAVLQPKPDVSGLRGDVRAFYKLFYHLDLTEAQLDELLSDAVTSAR